MALLLPLLTGLLAMCLDLFLREAWSLDAWSPDWLAVMLLWLGTTRGWGQGALVAATLGLLADGFAGSPAGVHMLRGLLLFYLSRSLASRVLFQGFVGRLLLGLAGGLVSLALLAVIARVFLGETALPGRLVQLVVPRVLVVVLAVPLVFPVLDRLDAWLVRRTDSDLL